MFSRSVPRALAAAVGTAVLALAGACTSTPVPVGGDAPAGAAFYQPPSPLRGSAPGDVQWYRSIATSTYPNADVYLTLYRSIDAKGQPMAVSGAVIVPKARWTGSGPRPIVGFAPATVGLTDDCAPTHGITEGTGGFMEGVNIKQLLGRGWAVAVTDYQGLGTPGRHTYSVRSAQGHAVLDVVRAAMRLAPSGLSAEAPVLLWGYSQGGGAAAGAAELAATYAPELRVKGTAVGGVPGDLLELSKHLDGGYFGLALAGAIGHGAAYPELDLDRYLNAAGKAEVAKLGDDGSTGACTTKLLNGYVGQRSPRYFTVDVTTLPDWRERFQEDQIGNVRPSAPVYEYHAALDQIIPPAIGQATRQRWCAAGATVQYNGTFVGEHLTVAVTAAGSAVDYLADRLAGKAARSSC